MKNLFLFIWALSFGCTEIDKSIALNTSEFSKLELTDAHNSIQLIKAYPNGAKCDKERTNANIYLSLFKNDTLIIIEPCKKIHDFAKNDFKYKDDLDLIIDIKDVESNGPTRVFVSRDAIVKKNYKYIVASITRLEY